MNIIDMVRIGKPFGLWGMLVLIPFILLYLIRPKVKDKVIPSLMFLMKQQRISIQASFFRTLMRNFLFFIQFLTLAGLAFSLAMPYITIPYKASSENTVAILDVSASMHTKHGMSTRFDKALSEIKPKLSGRISIIAAENQPLILLKEEKKDEALRILSKLNPKATTTNIGDALSIAKDILKGKKGKVVIASDFISDESSDILVMRRDLMAKGHVVEFINLANKARNIGIIDMKVSKYETKIRVKNYNDGAEDVTVKLLKDNGALDEETVAIAANSIEALSFETPLGTSMIQLDVKDDFEIDNSAYISTPLSKKIRTLLVTNEKTSYLMYALEASKDIDLEVRHPPTINAFNIDHDIVIIDKVDKSEVIPSDIVDIKRYVNDRGGKLIITAQEDLAQIDMLGMLPIVIDGLSEPSIVCIDLVNQFTQQFDDNECFTSSKYFKGTAKEGSAVIASAGNTPIMVLSELGKGTVFYYGIFDDTSNFKTQPAYPIFWNSLINYLVGTGSMEDYNFKTGALLSIKEQDVTTPSTTMTTSKLIFDEIGWYKLESKTIAASLLDETESDVSGETILDETEAELTAGKESEKTDMSLEIGLVILALFLLWIELFYIKRRGDI
ncbi:BatA and WFA domain-containing protein [Candidatus Woesearchaeota archaeon]|nr:BatA and WFA domain-containing protein [Candidatus Woesearchaeota archaeon]